MEEHLIKTNLSEQLRDFDNLLDKNLTLHVFDIDCSKMERYGELIFDKRKESYLGRLYESLDNISTSAIYWFEYSSVEEAEESEKDYLKFKNDQIKRFKGTEKYRSTPALNKNTGSKYFYVGVRKGGKRKRDGLTHIAGRIYHHLGCYSKGSTSGLQLVHWSNKTIRLSVLELPKGASKYLYILEKFYAIKLRPLLGRH